MREERVEEEMDREFGRRAVPRAAEEDDSSLVLKGLRQKGEKGETKLREREILRKIGMIWSQSRIRSLSFQVSLERK